MRKGKPLATKNFDGVDRGMLGGRSTSGGGRKKLKRSRKTVLSNANSIQSFKRPDTDKARNGKSKRKRNEIRQVGWERIASKAPIPKVVRGKKPSQPVQCRCPGKGGAGSGENKLVIGRDRA